MDAWISAKHPLYEVHPHTGMGSHRSHHAARDEAHNLGQHQYLLLTGMSILNQSQTAYHTERDGSYSALGSRSLHGQAKNE